MISFINIPQEPRKAFTDNFVKLVELELSSEQAVEIDEELAQKKFEQLGSQKVFPRFATEVKLKHRGKDHQDPVAEATSTKIGITAQFPELVWR